MGKSVKPDSEAHSNMNLSFIQSFALDPNRHWVVSTGAGAGKTRVLVERYLHLLMHEPSLKVNEILALTFTQKAAEEMKSRIYQEILTQLAQSNLDTTKIERLQQIREEFQNNQISTFHSFCHQLLKKYPVESKVDPNFKVMSDIYKT